MEFRGGRGQNQRTEQSAAQPLATAAAPSLGGSPLASRSSGPARGGRKLPKIGLVAILFAGVILVVLVILALAFGKNSTVDSIKKDNYQAVFLNNGQVYFGKINSIDSRSIDLRGIYYLQTNTTSDASSTTAQNSNVSLVKLGCELHAPYDQMVINAEQVIFWENIQDSSQVVKAIKTNQSKSSGEQCSTASQSSTQQSPSTTTPTPSPTPSTTTKP